MVIKCQAKKLDSLLETLAPHFPEEYIFACVARRYAGSAVPVTDYEPEEKPKS